MVMQRRIKSIVAYFILTLWTLVVAIPVYWLIITAFKNAQDINSGATFIPWVDFQPGLHAFRDVFFNQGLVNSRPFINSIVVAISTAAIAALAVHLRRMAAQAL